MTSSAEESELPQNFSVDKKWLQRVIRQGLASELDAALTAGLFNPGQKKLGMLMTAHYGQQQCLNTLLKHQVSLDVCDKHGEGPLHKAAQCSSESIVGPILQAAKETLTEEQLKTFVNRLSRPGLRRDEIGFMSHADGMTALHHAVILENEENVDLLLASGADPNMHGPINDIVYTPLSQASELGHVNIVRMLLQHGANVNARGDQMCTSLQAAAEVGADAVVKLLLEAGASVDQDSRYSETPLMVALELGHVKVVDLLLEHGADLTCKDDREQSMVYYCVLSDKPALLNLVLKHLPPDFEHDLSLHQACRMGGNVDMVEPLLRHGWDVRMKDHNGYGVLLSALPNHDWVSVLPQYLVNRTPLLEVILKRLQEVASPEEMTYEVSSALAQACMTANPAHVDLLLANGGDPNLTVKIIGDITCSALSACWHTLGPYDECSTMNALRQRPHRLKILTSLLQTGCSVNHPLSLKESPGYLLHAVRPRQLKTSRLLHHAIATRDMTVARMTWEAGGELAGAWTMVMDEIMHGLRAKYYINQNVASWFEVQDFRDNIVLQPRSLFATSAIFIRNYLYTRHGSLAQNVSTLEIPEHLKDCLLLKHLEQIVRQDDQQAARNKRKPENPNPRPDFEYDLDSSPSEDDHSVDSSEGEDDGEVGLGYLQEDFSEDDNSESDVSFLSDFENDEGQGEQDGGGEP